MTRTRHPAAGFLSFSTAAILALSAVGGVAAGPAAASKDKSQSAVSSAVLSSTGAAEYWTEERMRNAIPGEALAAKAFERRNPSDQVAVKKGKEKTVDATKKKSTIAVHEEPVSHIGKVFVVLNGADYVCSGNAVSSANKSTVVTAGHCLSEGPEIRPTHFIFVPGYEDGYAPDGEWEGNSYFVPQQWSDNGDFGFDTGFAVVDKLGGQNLTDAVGASEVVFNEHRLLHYKAFGYPADKPFDGETLKSCTGTATPDTTNPQFGTQGVACDMNGGSSGGPWFLPSNDPDTLGHQNSINSYSYEGSDVMYGPYWGQEIEATYKLASIS